MSDESTWTMAVDPGESMSFDELRAVFRQFDAHARHAAIAISYQLRSFAVFSPQHYLVTIPRQEDLADAVIDLKKRLAE